MTEHPATAGVAELLRPLAEGHGVELPTLTVEELGSLGALRTGPVRRDREREWWEGFAAEQRALMTVTALRGLAARGLIEPGELLAVAGRALDGVRPAPQLALILAARSRPAFIVLGAEPASQQVSLRLYGMVDAGQGRRAVLVERTGEIGLHRFSVWGAAPALKMLTRWATEPPPEGGPPRERAVEIGWPAGERSRRVEMVVRTAPGAVSLTERGDGGGWGEPSPTSVEAMEERLAALLGPA